MPWWGSALATGTIMLFVSAGIWQWQRAAEKRALLTAFTAGSVPLTGLVTDAEAGARRYQRLRIEGTYDPAHQVLLDNMIADGRAGYHVLTPLRTASGLILVNRGWVPAEADRTQLPKIAVNDRSRMVTGRIDQLPRPGLPLAPTSPPATAPWPRRLVFPTAAEIGGQLGYAVQTYQLLLDGDQPDGYGRAWRPVEMGPERHLGYAVQWFAMAATVLVIYTVMARKKRRNT